MINTGFQFITLKTPFTHTKSVAYVNESALLWSETVHMIWNSSHDLLVQTLSKCQYAQKVNILWIGFKSLKFLICSKQILTTQFTVLPVIQFIPVITAPLVVPVAAVSCFRSHSWSWICLDCEWYRPVWR